MFPQKCPIGGKQKKITIEGLDFFTCPIGNFLFFIHLNVKTSVIPYNKWAVWPKIKTFLVIDFSEP